MSAEQTKARILNAAFREFAGHGLAGARVDRIAKNAECNKNLIYIYFQNKEALFATVLDRHMTEVFAGVPFTAQDLPAVARRAFDQARANPDVFRLLAWATLEHAAAMPQARRQEYDRALALVREQQASGGIGNDAPPELILMSVLTLATAWAPVFPFGEAAAPDTGLSPDAVRDWIADMVGRIAGQN